MAVTQRSTGASQPLDAELAETGIGLIPGRVGAGRPRRRSVVGFGLGIAVLLLLACVAAAPGLFTGVDPNAADLRHTLRGPSGDHWFGTDQNGRDLYARIVYGARPSLLIGVGASLMSLVGGVVVGVLAAQSNRVVDQVISRLLDVVMSVPGLLLVFLVVAVLGTGSRNAAVGLAVVGIPGFARVTRAEVIRVRSGHYVEAAHGLGWSKLQVVVRHIVPNTVGPIVALATVGLGSMIVASSSLSFVGLGPRPPTAEWGAMLAGSRNYLEVAWWPAVFPGLALTIAVLAVTVVGERIQGLTR
ncbi:ABC transporter permease [Frankia sp. AvcI1]|uniref:ABC transporter permease n=1 Tax=Frankia sp. AvcI1 TaxID=573496 RepID=UPI0021182F47|nr:ABC transporter permease [Frankia sp. AvcI1]